MVRGYKFLCADLRSGHGNEGPWSVGETRAIAGRLILCERGYHSSPTWRAALRYAPRECAAAVVEASDDGPDTVQDGDKRVSRTLRIVAVAPAEATRLALITWACDCAERALVRERERGREPHADSWAAIETTRRYVRGECDLDAVRLGRTAARQAYAAAADAAAADAADAAAAYADAAADAADAAAYAADAAAYAAARKVEEGWQGARLAELLDAAVAANGGAA